MHYFFEDLPNVNLVRPTCHPPVGSVKSHLAHLKLVKILFENEPSRTELKQKIKTQKTTLII